MSGRLLSFCIPSGSNRGVLVRVVGLLWLTAIATAQEKPAVPTETPATPPAGEQDVLTVLEQTIDRMEGVGDDLAKKQVSQKTLQTQKQILSGLDQLILRAEQLPQTGQRSQPKQQPPDQDGNKQPESSGTAQQQSDTRRTDENPQDSTNAPGRTDGGTEVSANRKRVIVRQIWGHLPPGLQRRVLNTSDVEPLPKYKRLVEKYFEAIAEQSKSPTGAIPARSASQ